jgi:hypothetical protein
MSPLQTFLVENILRMFTFAYMLLASATVSAWVWRALRA